MIKRLQDQNAQANKTYRVCAFQIILFQISFKFFFFFFLHTQNLFGLAGIVLGIVSRINAVLYNVNELLGQVVLHAESPQFPVWIDASRAVLWGISFLGNMVDGRQVSIRVTHTPQCWQLSQVYQLSGSPCRQCTLVAGWHVSNREHHSTAASLPAWDSHSLGSWMLVCANPWPSRGLQVQMWGSPWCAGSWCIWSRTARCKCRPCTRWCITLRSHSGVSGKWNFIRLFARWQHICTI